MVKFFRAGNNPSNDDEEEPIRWKRILFNKFKNSIQNSCSRINKSRLGRKLAARRIEISRRKKNQFISSSFVFILLCRKNFYYDENMRSSFSRFLCAPKHILSSCERFLFTIETFLPNLMFKGEQFNVPLLTHKEGAKFNGLKEC